MGDETECKEAIGNILGDRNVPFLECCGSSTAIYKFVKSQATHLKWYIMCELYPNKFHFKNINYKFKLPRLGSNLESSRLRLPGCKGMQHCCFLAEFYIFKWLKKLKEAGLGGSCL